MNRCRAHIKIVFTLMFFILSVHNICSQIAEKSVADSIRLLPVKLTEIPVRYGETLFQTRKILDNLISREEMYVLKSNNDSILDWFEKEKNKTIESEAETKNIRYLENRWLQVQTRNVNEENS